MTKAANLQRTDVSFVDTSLAVGQHALWSGELSDDDALTVLTHLNGGRFDRIEIPSPARRLARTSGVTAADLTTWDQRAVEACPQTPLRWVGPIDLPLPDGRRSTELGRLLLKRAAAAGVHEIRLGDATNSVAQARHMQAIASEAGLRFVGEVAFTTSPRHDDEYYVALSRQLAEVGLGRLCLTDPSGLLTPERVAELVPKLLATNESVTWEFLGHCNNWLGPLNALAAAEAGVSVLHSAIPPLSSAESAPPLDLLVDNLRARDRGVRAQPDALGPASELLRFLALRSRLPIPSPREYDDGRLRHHLAEPQISRLRERLDQEELAAAYAPVLDEVEAVRADLGHPVMTPEVSDAVVAQAIGNVMVRSRYEPLVPALAQLVATWPSDVVTMVDPGLQKQLGVESDDGRVATSSDVGLAELRSSNPGRSEEGLIEQAVLCTSLSDAEREKRLRTPIPSSSPVVRLVRSLASGLIAGSISIEKPGFRLHLTKDSPSIGKPDDVLAASQEVTFPRQA